MVMDKRQVTVVGKVRSRPKQARISPEEKTESDFEVYKFTLSDDASLYRHFMVKVMALLKLQVVRKIM